MSWHEISSSKKFEDYAYVLDYLPHGKPSIALKTYRAEPIVQVMGETYFTLLEASTRRGIDFNSGERVYVGRGFLREEITRVLGRIAYNDLTSTAKVELNTSIEKALRSQEARVIDIFNNAQAVTPRMHSLELIPGIGKKYMREILRQRELKLFLSFDDLRERTGIPDPIKLVVRRVQEELIEEPKHRMFTRPP